MNYPVAEQQFAVPAAPAPAFIGQGTAVEQSRAVAEVQAAVVVARQFPRNEALAVQKMRTGFAQHSLAVRSFFRFSRGGSTISGETIQFAKELARCWTNIHYGVHELRRDDAAGESEMQAWAWDLETNERASTTFIVPHTRWTKTAGGTRLEDPRDVYENNSNNGAPPPQEMIFSVLPDWFREQAKTIATNTLEKGQGDKPLAQRAADCIAHFEGLGVTVDQLEEHRGRASEKWTNLDLGQLSIISESIRRGEVTVDEEFPQQRVTAGEIRQQHQQQAEQPTVTVAAEGGQWPATPAAGDGGVVVSALTSICRLVLPGKGRRRAATLPVQPADPTVAMLRPVEALVNDLAWCPAEDRERLHAFLRTGGRVCWTCRTVTDHGPLTSTPPTGGVE